MQDLQQLSDRIAKLSPARQAVVEKLVERLESDPLQRQLDLDQAVDEFEREHPELLRLLAQ